MNFKFKTINLSNIALVFNGKTPSISEQRSDGYPILKIKDILASGKFSGKFQSFVDELFFLKFNSKCIKKGDTLILNAAHNSNYVGTKTFYANFEIEDAIPTGEWLVIRPRKREVNSLYIYYFLISPNGKSYIKGLVKGIHLYPKDVGNVPIPLPPLSVQRQIAAVLERADGLRKKRKEAIEKLDQLIQSVFLDMFGDPFTNPKGWKKVKTIDVSKCIVPGRDKPKNFTGNIPWITTDDLRHLDKTTISKKGLGLNLEEIKKVNARIIPKDSVLLTCVGDLGVISIAGNILVVNQQLHSFQCSPNINNFFLMFNISFHKLYMYKMASSTTIPYMNKTVCNNIPTIIPPIDLQNRFASIYQTLTTEKGKMESQLVKLDEQFNSLIQRAFSGELMFNDDRFNEMNKEEWRDDQ